jgi:hypothetical protein
VATDGPIVFVEHPVFGDAVLCRLADAEKWRAANGATSTGTDTWQVRANGAIMHARIVDDSLIVCHSADFHTASQSGGAIAKGWTELADARPASVAFYVNLDPLRPMLMPGMMLARQTMRAGLMSRGGVSEGALDFWDQVFDTTAKAIESAQTVRGTLEVGRAGVGVVVEVQFDPASDTARYLSAVRPVSEPLLRKLPALDAICAFGSEWKLADGQTTLYGLFAQGLLLGTRLRGELGEEKFAQGMARLDEFNSSLIGSSAMLVVRPETRELITFGYNIFSEPERGRALMKALYDLSPAMLNASITNMVASAGYTEEKAGDVTIDGYALDFSQEDQETRLVIEHFYGRRPGFLNTVANGAMIFGVGPYDATLDLMTKHVKAGADAPKFIEQERVQRALAALEAQPQFVALYDLPRCAVTFAALARKVGAPLPELRADGPLTPFVGVGGYLRPHAVRLQIVAPAEALAASMSLFRQATEDTRKIPTPAIEPD